MKTLRFVVDSGQMKALAGGFGVDAAEDVIGRAAAMLRGGGLVAMPTETVYGLGANALDGAAVMRIFAAKRRPAWDPVIVHIADEAMLEVLVTEIPETARRLMRAYWPGPLTLLLPRSAAVPDAVTAGRPLVGIRMPAHPVALALIRRAGVPVAAPSANLFSHISPTTAAHVLADLDGRIDAVLDAGPVLHGVESTVLDPCQSPMVIYRPGAITVDQIRETAGVVEFYRDRAEREGVDLEETPQEALPAPGVGLRHYAPHARLVLVDGPLDGLEERLAAAVQGFAEERVGVMLPEEVAAPAGVAANRLYAWGPWAAPERLAHALYAGLRELDNNECSVILCPLPPAAGIGEAIRDRLRKAAHPGRK